MPELMDENYTPKTGRPPLVDITSMKKMADENPGRWIAEIYDDKNTASVRRQFMKLGKYDISVTKAEPGYKRIMVRTMDLQDAQSNHWGAN